MWDCVLTPPSGCFTPNHNSETNTAQGRADYTVISTFFIMYGYFLNTNMRFGYEVPGMILFCNLQIAMRFDSSKYMSVCVSSCSSYDLNTLTAVVCKLWH
jgi:hypothetical protein